MITFKTLLETVYEPKSGDEKNFKDKHVVAKYKTPYDTESQFTSTATKAKRKADYNSKEDEQVYEAAELHTKRADKEAVIVRAVDPNTGQSKARVVKRGTGEIKIGEAMDPVGKHDADIDNDGDTDKSDKYLIARRKAIGKAMRKEEVKLDESRKLLAARKSAERAADQGVRVDKQTYNWGKMVTVHDGIRKSFPLHPEHQEKIKNLKHGESTTFTDETRNKVKAHREGDTVHLQRTDSDKKTSVPYSHFAEEVDLDEAKKPKPGHNASVMAKNISKVLAAVKKEEVELDEVSASTLGSYIRKASKGKEAAYKSREDALDNDDGETARKMGRLARKRDKGTSMAMDKLKGTRYAKVHATEEVELDEAFKIGAMKLKDGSTVTLNRESVDMFNKLFNQLNSTNKAKMEERMMSSKSGFQEILSFAENI